MKRSFFAAGMNMALAVVAARGAAFIAGAALMVVALVAGLAPAMAVEIAGVKVAEKLAIGEGGPELVLNGAGLRTRAFFRVYVGALYLQQKTSSAQTAIADAGAKRIAMHILRDVTADQFFSSLNDGLKANHAQGDLAKIEPQLKQLEGIFQAVKSTRNGDTIVLDYIPGAGTRVVINGDGKGTIAGEEFNRALLRIWLGDQPADAGLKKAMLGG